MRWLAQAAGFLMLGMVVIWCVGIKSYADYLSIPKLAAAQFHRFNDEVRTGEYSSVYVSCEAVFVPSTGKLAVSAWDSDGEYDGSLGSSYCNRAMSGATQYTKYARVQKTSFVEYAFLGAIVIVLCIGTFGVFAFCLMVTDLVGLRGAGPLLGLASFIWGLATVAIVVSGFLGGPPDSWRFALVAGKDYRKSVDVEQVVITQDGKLLTVAPTTLDWAVELSVNGALSPRENSFDQQVLKDLARAD